MKYTLDYLDDKKITEVKLKDRINFQRAEQYSKEAVKLARDNDCNKFLFDLSETIIKGNSINYHCAGADLQQFGFKNSDKIAVIIKNYTKNISQQENEDANANWITSKYFNKNEIEKAIEWLIQ